MASPCSAALRYHATASAGSLTTPTPFWYVIQVEFRLHQSLLRCPTPPSDCFHDVHGNPVAGGVLRTDGELRRGVAAFGGLQLQEGYLVRRSRDARRGQGLLGWPFGLWRTVCPNRRGVATIGSEQQEHRDGKSNHRPALTAFNGV